MSTARALLPPAVFLGFSVSVMCLGLGSCVGDVLPATDSGPDSPAETGVDATVDVSNDAPIASDVQDAPSDSGPCAPSVGAIEKSGVGRGIAPASSTWDLKNEMSVEYWIKLNAITLGANRISEMTVMTSAGVSNAWFTELSPAYQRTLLSTAYGVMGRELNANFTFQTSHWYHVAYEYDGVTSRTFIDGTPNGSMPMTGTIQSPAGITLVIASWGDAPNSDPGFFVMRELRIGNKALYSGNFTPSWNLAMTTGTVALYHMTESNNVLVDSTGQSPPITLTGAFSSVQSGVYCP